MQKSSAVTTLKELLLILSGLAITNGLIVLVVNGDFEIIKPIKDVSSDFLPLLFFFTLLLNIVRFFLGNMRTIDDCYLNSYKDVASDGTYRIKNLPLDYTIVLLTSIFLAILSFYIRDFKSFYLVFSIMLLVDILWLLVTRKDTQDSEIRKQRKWWMFNNILFLVPISLGFFAPTNGFLSVLPLIFILVNTAVDFKLSYKFYFFPFLGKNSSNIKLFLAAPFTQYLENGLVTLNHQEGIKRVYSELEQNGFEIFSAHQEEEMGKDLDDPATAIVRDLKELKEADILIAFIGDPPSPGVQMEIGAAITMDKPIIYLIKEGEKAPYLTDGIPIVTQAHRINYQDYENASKQIIKLIGSLIRNNALKQSI